MVAMPTEDVRAKDIIAMRDRARTKQENFRNLWQQTADLVFPRENRITSTPTPGEDKSVKLYDTTAVQDSQDMASGLSGAIIPTGQKFFGLKVKDAEVARNERVKRWLMIATEILHDELFESNFMLQFNETLRSLVVYGTGCLFSEWDNELLRLNFKDYDIALYQIEEDARGTVDTIIITYKMTARQAISEFGVAKLNEKILRAVDDPKNQAEEFEFINIVRPRRRRNPGKRDPLNKSWESLHVDVQGKEVVKEHGFDDFPYAVPRWMKSSFEIYGRGQGTEHLADVKVLQQIKRDFVECGNRWNNPPREVLDTFEGNVNVTPGAVNHVRETGTIKALDQALSGNFPIT